MSGQYRRCQQCPLWCQVQFFFLPHAGCIIYD
jgi:hypothetical protein